MQPLVIRRFPRPRRPRLTSFYPYELPRETGGVTHGPVSLAPDVATDWKERAACSGYPNTLFFPAPETSAETLEHAISICSTCEVAAKCLEYSLETNQRSGVWGGTSEDQRKSLRRKWLAERRRTA